MTSESIVDTASTDLTSALGVQAYLASTPFASDTVTPISGGTANFTYRIHLMTPFEGQETLVVKHAQPYVKNLSSIPFWLDRQAFEYEAMTRIKAWLPADSPVTVPIIYKFDPHRNVLIMEDCGIDALTLKEFMQQGSMSEFKSAAPGLAATIGTSLGRFLGAMHAWSRTDPDGILELFAKNVQATRLSAWATYGRVVATLKPGDGDNVPPALADPPIVVSESDMGVVSKVAEEMSGAITAARDVFVMGDFWPGNIMITFDSQQRLERLYILDWELAKPGIPGVEIGQFCAEMHLLRRFTPAIEESVSTVLNTFLQAYANERQPEEEVARNALMHWGTHLVVWTPRVQWGDKDTTRKVVEEGLRIIIAASSATKEYLSSSLVSPLVSQSQ